MRVCGGPVLGRSVTGLELAHSTSRSNLRKKDVAMLGFLVQLSIRDYQGTCDGDEQILGYQQPEIVAHGTRRYG
jgi:hypothetical protein